MTGILDAGNSQIKAAVFDGYYLAKKAVFQDFKRELADFFIQNNVKTIFLGSVVHIPDSFQLEFGLSFQAIDSTSKLPIINAYNSPQTLGIDRLANAVEAYHQNNSKPALSIDMGTCIKFDYVNQQGHYLGGAISPGMQMRFKSLHHFTQKLPAVDFNGIAPLVGTTSLESIQSGVINGIIAEIDGIIDRYLHLDHNIKVFLTGGDAQFFNQSLKNIIFADPFLTLNGLNRIAKLNGA